MATAIASSLEGKNILVAKDVEEVQPIQSILARANAKVLVCGTNELTTGTGELCHCADYLATHPDYKPDVIISNWGEPDTAIEADKRTTPGSELLKIRAREMADVPIIFITETNMDIAADPNFDRDKDLIRYRPRDIVREAQQALGKTSGMQTSR